MCRKLSNYLGMVSDLKMWTETTQNVKLKTTVTRLRALGGRLFDSMKLQIANIMSSLPRQKKPQHIEQ